MFRLANFGEAIDVSDNQICELETAVEEIQCLPADTAVTELCDTVVVPSVIAGGGSEVAPLLPTSPRPTAFLCDSLPDSSLVQSLDLEVECFEADQLVLTTPVAPRISYEDAVLTECEVATPSGELEVRPALTDDCVCILLRRGALPTGVAPLS